jgi:hypothetical protein
MNLRFHKKKSEIPPALLLLATNVGLCSTVFHSLVAKYGPERKRWWPIWGHTHLESLKKSAWTTVGLGDYAAKTRTQFEYVWRFHQNRDILHHHLLATLLHVALNQICCCDIWHGRLLQFVVPLEDAARTSHSEYVTQGNRILRPSATEKKIVTLYGTRRFINVFTRVRHQPL